MCRAEMRVQCNKRPCHFTSCWKESKTIRDKTNQSHQTSPQQRNNQDTVSSLYISGNCDWTSVPIIPRMSVVHLHNKHTWGFEDPEPTQINEDLEELCTSEDGEQLQLRQEIEAFELHLWQKWPQWISDSTFWSWSNSECSRERPSVQHFRWKDAIWPACWNRQKAVHINCLWGKVQN